MAQIAAPPELTPHLRRVYEWRFASCELRPSALKTAERAVARIAANKSRYQQVEDATGVPWYVVGIIHQLECEGRFDRHIANGEPLHRKTRKSPSQASRSWEGSAIRALRHERGRGAWKGIPAKEWQRWDLANTLYRIEGFNGWGYWVRGRISPYLWGGTSLYDRGKYVRDGKFSHAARSLQVGGGPLLRILFNQSESLAREASDLWFARN